MKLHFQYNFQLQVCAKPFCLGALFILVPLIG
uniref:Uncharacterized protein n=1 Tax=Rhizophora mucronata TaxID=61149 RepID=A0A2P2Q636_RHIMU